jgi:UDP-N-acetylglucosamine acyltransferase
VGDKTIFANNAQLAGHVQVGDWAILGGFTVVHQFVRIGAHCMTGMGTILLQDVPTYVMANGNPSAPHGINVEGLKRRGFSPEAIATLRRAYKTLYRNGLKLDEARAEIEAAAASEAALVPLAEFLAAAGRGIIR